MNVNSIGYGEIEDFLHSQDVPDKTKYNMKLGLHSFLWVKRRKKIQIPEFPETPFELGFRKIIDKDPQASIHKEVYRQTFHINPKTWLGIKWLFTYIYIRPNELLKIKGKDINTKLEYFIIPYPKDKKTNNSSFNR